jgi:hypothetical protein
MVLILFTERLDVRFYCRDRRGPCALLPRFFELGCCDVPVGPTFPGQGARILAEILEVGHSSCPVPESCPT